MIKSMTGFGRGKFAVNGRDYTVEIRTVNHRYNDITIKIPRYLMALEDSIRKLVSEEISRGKTDVYISINNTENSEKNIKIDTALAGAVVSELKRVAEVYQIQDGITATALMKVPDMIVVDETNIDEKMYFEELRQCIVLALDSLKKARETEGNNLREDILKRLDLISNEVNNMASRATTLVDEYRKKLEKRIEELGATNIVDENRIATEIVLFADKTSICEEVTRLKSHINSFKEMLDSEGAIGKKLDFLTQEMNREVNTIASKANCIDIVDGIIVAKNEIENIREQVQNIE